MLREVLSQWAVLMMLVTGLGFFPAATRAAAAAPEQAEGGAGQGAAAAGSEAPEAAERDALEALRAEVERLRQELAALEAAAGASGDARIAEIERKLEVLAQEIERLRLGEAAAEADASQYGFGPAASKVYRTRRGVSIGGYGELLYQAFDSTRDDGAPSGRTDELDLLRAIVYVGYKFSDRFLFNSEIEFEHAKTGEGEEGEVALEFGYLDYLWKPELGFRGGLLLVPMGFLNELHEPTAFLGARRPGIETAILPTTWRENGFGIFGQAGDWSYRSYVLNGFDASGFTAGGLRGGRQNGSRAKAEDFAWVGRLDWTGVPGLLAGGSAYFGDSGQDLATADGREVDAGVSIFEGHLEWKWKGLEARLLGVEAEVDDVALLNDALGFAGAGSIGERMGGYYAQLAYDLFARRPRGEQALLPYVRWETYDTQKEVPAGFEESASTDIEILTAGLAYRPIDPIILKFDYQDIDNAAGTGVDQYNIAVGYIF